MTEMLWSSSFFTKTTPFAPGCAALGPAPTEMVAFNVRVRTSITLTLDDPEFATYARLPSLLSAVWDGDTPTEMASSIASDRSSTSVDPGLGRLRGPHVSVRRKHDVVVRRVNPLRRRERPRERADEENMPWSRRVLLVAGLGPAVIEPGNRDPEQGAIRTDRDLVRVGHAAKADGAGDDVALGVDDRNRRVFTVHDVHRVEPNLVDRRRRQCRSGVAAPVGEVVEATRLH